jgi:hypothetical protein
VSKKRAHKLCDQYLVTGGWQLTDPVFLDDILCNDERYSGSASNGSTPKSNLCQMEKLTPCARESSPSVARHLASTSFGRPLHETAAQLSSGLPLLQNEHQGHKKSDGRL